MIKLFHEVFVGLFVVEFFEEGDDFVDMRVFFFKFLVVAATLERISCFQEAAHFFVKLV